jgi:hypothetical protein
MNYFAFAVFESVAGFLPVDLVENFWGGAFLTVVFFAKVFFAVVFVASGFLAIGLLVVFTNFDFTNGLCAMEVVFFDDVVNFLCWMLFCGFATVLAAGFIETVLLIAVG